jgi:hypothetical protein
LIVDGLLLVYSNVVYDFLGMALIIHSFAAVRVAIKLASAYSSTPSTPHLTFSWSVQHYRLKGIGHVSLPHFHVSCLEREVKHLSLRKKAVDRTLNAVMM